MHKKIYIIAGEASGDFLGAQLMRSLRKSETDIEFLGIGGPLMITQGLTSLFAMNELSIMGVAEVAPKIPQLVKRINETVRDIEAQKPDIIITIDAPDFGFRVQKKIKKRGLIDVKQVHYVAPTVWAWRPKRAKKIAKFLDGIICLFPFEPPYFEKEGLKAIAAGHPMMETNIGEAQPLQLGDKNTKKLGVFFGSRHGEIKRMAPVLIDAVSIIVKEQPNIELIIPTLAHLKDNIEERLKDINVPYHLSTEQDDKWSLFKTCDAAIAVSGTVGLELAVANVAHLIAYKTNFLTYHLLKFVLTTKYAHLANIILQKEIVPEFIQNNSTAANIAQKAIELLANGSEAQKQRAQFDVVREELGQHKKSSNVAAQFILDII